MDSSSRIKTNCFKIKINVVAMKDFNDDELVDFIELTKENNITVRFIELMPFDSHQIWKTGNFIKQMKYCLKLNIDIKISLMVDHLRNIIFSD